MIMAIRKLEIDGGLHSGGKPETQFLKKYVMVLGSRYVPLVIKAVGENAVRGDLEAARWLFNYVGLIDRSTGW